MQRNMYAINFESGILRIILVLDSSLKGFGGGG